MSTREKCLLIGNVIISHKQNCEGLEVAKDMQLLTFRLMNFMSEVEKITPEGEDHEFISHLLEKSLQILSAVEEFQEKHSYYHDKLCDEVKAFGRRVDRCFTSLASFREENPDIGYFYEELHVDTSMKSRR